MDERLRLKRLLALEVFLNAENFNTDIVEPLNLSTLTKEENELRFLNCMKYFLDRSKYFNENF